MVMVSYPVVASFLTLLVATKGDILTGKTELWPSGTYGLPKAISGCPGGGVRWSEGLRKQHLENRGRSKVSHNFHMETSMKGQFISRTFCVKKTNWRGKGILWPKGSYCIYKKGYCPRHMASGFIYWDDEDTRNKNRQYGSLPDGLYGYDTRIDYCCQNQGPWYESIMLPTDKPFYLLPFKYPVCQRVKWARSSLEYITYDTENSSNRDMFEGLHAATDAKKSFPKVFYCYYESCRHQIVGNKGWIRSGKSNTEEYPDHQYCSWSITVDKKLVVSLEFDDIHVPNCQENYIDFYDGSNETSPFLAKICGSKATKKSKLLSTGNTIYMVVKSGDSTKAPHKLGFVVKYEAKLNPRDCHHHASANLISFNSIDGTYRNFPDFKRCSWLITATQGHVVVLEFTYMNLTNCNESYVILFDGYEAKGTPLAKLCGENAAVNKKFVSSSNRLLIVQQSDDAVNPIRGQILGFRVQYKAAIQPTTSPTERDLKRSQTSQEHSDTGNKNKTHNISPGEKRNDSLKLILIIVPILALVIVIVSVLAALVRQRKKQANDAASSDYETRFELPSASSQQQLSPKIKDEDCSISPNPLYETSDAAFSGKVSDSAKDNVNVLYEPAGNTNYNADELEYKEGANPLYCWPENYTIAQKCPQERHQVVPQSSGDDGLTLKATKEQNDCYVNVGQILRENNVAK